MSSANKNFNIKVSALFTLVATVFYTVCLWGAGHVYQLIHPYIALYAHSFWFVLMFVMVLSARFMDIAEMRGEDEGKYIDEFLIGLNVAAMLAFPFHFALICEALSSNFTDQFFYSEVQNIKLLDWLGFAWFNLLEALLLDIPSIYGIAISSIQPASFLAKTLTFIFRLSIDTLFLFGAYNLYRQSKSLD